MGESNDAARHVATDRLRSPARRRPARPKIVVIEERITSTNQSFAHLSDDELLATVKGLATSERRATAALVRSLMELDVRRLHLGEGYSSLFTYCTQALHLAEGAAYNRIEAARAARRLSRRCDLCRQFHRRFVSCPNPDRSRWTRNLSSSNQPPPRRVHQ